MKRGRIKKETKVDDARTERETSITPVPGRNPNTRDTHNDIGPQRCGVWYSGGTLL